MTRQQTIARSMRTARDEACLVAALLPLAAVFVLLAGGADDAGTAVWRGGGGLAIVLFCVTPLVALRGKLLRRMPLSGRIPGTARPGTAGWRASGGALAGLEAGALGLFGVLVLLFARSRADFRPKPNRAGLAQPDAGLLAARHEDLAP